MICLTHIRQFANFNCAFILQKSLQRNARGIFCHPVYHTETNVIKNNITEWNVIYKLPLMKYVRLVSRFKIYQIALMCGLCIPLCKQYGKELVPKKTLLLAFAGCVGTSIVFVIFSYFSTRLLGQLSVSPCKSKIRISRLNFYGSRKEDIYQASKVVPWTDSSNDLSKRIQTLYVIDDKDKEKAYLYTLKHSNVKDRELLCDILGIPL